MIGRPACWVLVAFITGAILPLSLSCHADALLAVPFLAQGSGNSNCGPVSLVMAACYAIGEQPSLEKVEQVNTLLGVSDEDLKGSAQLVRASRALYGIEPAEGHWDLEAVRRELDAGGAVVVAVRAERLSNRGYRYPGAHFLVAIGYDADHMICNDPGTQGGQSKHYLNTEFTAAMEAQKGLVVSGFRLMVPPVLPPGVQASLTGTIVCAVGGELRAGPAAEGLPSRVACRSPMGTTLRGFAWCGDHRTVAVVECRDADRVGTRPLEECSNGTLALVDTVTGARRLVDATRRLDVSALAPSQPPKGVLFAGWARGLKGVLVADTRSGMPLRGIGGGDAVCSGGMDVSADGVYVAMSGKANIDLADGVLDVRCTATGATVVHWDDSRNSFGGRINDGPLRSWWSPAFAPSGHRLACMQEGSMSPDEYGRSAVVVTDVGEAPSTKVEYVLPPDWGSNDSYPTLAWSPDGRFLAVGCRDAQDAPGVLLLDLEEGRLWRWLAGADRVAWSG